MDEKTLLIIVLVLCIGFIVFFISRSGENYGMLKPSDAATENFQSNRAVADLEYWFSGPESYPLAIIGVERRLRFGTAKHWMKVGTGEKSLQRLIEGMLSRASQMNQNLRGFEMVDRKGERVGEWYSAVGVQAVIKRTGIDSIEVWPPSAEKPKP
jgi:flavin-binding protein dodecin